MLYNYNCYNKCVIMIISSFFEKRGNVVYLATPDKILKSENLLLHMIHKIYIAPSYIYNSQLITVLKTLVCSNHMWHHKCSLHSEKVLV